MAVAGNTTNMQRFRDCLQSCCCCCYLWILSEVLWWVGREATLQPPLPSPGVPLSPFGLLKYLTCSLGLHLKMGKEKKACF